MPAILTCFAFWLSAVVFETAIFSNVTWFHPNLLLLLSTIFCLHWKGSETHYIAVLYGLAADCFSSLPFGVFGLLFFVVSFVSRWYGTKVYQESSAVLAIFSGIVTFVHSCLVLFIMSLVFSKGVFSFAWLKDLVFSEVVPTMVLSIPVYRLLLSVENRYKIRLAERKF